MTSRTSEHITRLIERSNAFDAMADCVQDESIQDDPKQLLRQLQEIYGAWYADALAVIPAELDKSFREEYEGGIFSYKIKSFLQAGLDLNVMFAELAAQGSMSKWLHPVGTAFHSPLLAQRQILRNTAAQMSGAHGIRGTLDSLEEMMRHLPLALAVLGQMVQGRPGITVSDEYDLQRIVHAILCLHYRDVRPEEYGRSRAGARPRIDFLLKSERVAVELKMTRKSLGPKQLGDELAADVLRYQQHPDADAYFALVYDPMRHVINSHGFEKDFPTEAAFPTRVVIIR